MSTEVSTSAGQGLSRGKLKVSPAAIENSLVKIWREAATLASSAETSAEPKVRATLANLVILSPHVDDANAQRELNEIVSEICISYPSRLFVVQLLPSPDGSSSAEPLDTFVSSRCVRAASGAHICSEEIYIDVRPQGMPLVANLLLSLFVPDVASTLFLIGDAGKWAAQAQELVRSLKEVCDRLIYDSRAFSDYSAAVDLMLQGLRLRPAALAALTGQEVHNYTPVFSGARHLRDLAWPALKRWGSLVTEQFDNSRFTAEAVYISRARLKYQRAEHGRIPAEVLIFAGWIAEKLHWHTGQRASEKEAIVINCTTPSGTGAGLVFEGRSKEGVSFQAALMSVEFEIRGREKNFSVALERSGHTEVSIRAGGGLTAASHHAERHAPFQEHTPGELVVSCMMSAATDEDFFAAMRVAKEIDKLIHRKAQKG